MHEKEETEPYRAAPIGPKTYTHMPFALYARLGFQATGPYTYPDAAPGLEMAVTIEPARAAVPTPSTGGEAA